MNKARRKKLKILIASLEKAKTQLEELSLEEFNAASSRVAVGFDEAHFAADSLHAAEEELGSVLNNLEDILNK